ncbi:MAG: superoxide dismutase [Deltaproteobacteria bacterium]|nr:superoxide dismutase [Deltaproteobacteria bacterium]
MINRRQFLWTALAGSVAVAADISVFPQVSKASPPSALPPLPYAQNALEPYISAETMSYHYGKHHAAYVNNLNTLIKGTEFENESLEYIIMNASGGIFNNAAQTWNHAFYWNSLKPKGGGAPAGVLAEAIRSDFGSVDEFKKSFSQKAATLFGSGWVWLVKDKNRKLTIESTGNAGNPLTAGLMPLLTCDVWEHAYYIDYRNARAKYIEAYWNLVDWDFASINLAA